MKTFYTKDKFVSKAILRHGNKYDYSQVEYTDSKTKVSIICPEHGEFLQAPNKHLFGQECRTCGREKASLSRRKGIEYFIKRAQEKHGDKYDYSLAEYTTNETKLKIICPEHGIFEQTPECHYVSGCAKCSGNIQKTTEQFVKEANRAHNHRYSYSNSDYQGAHIKLKIVCPEHGEFLQTPDAHLNALSGCPYCGSGGTYSEWYFKNYEYKRSQDAVFYIVNMKSEEEEFIKVGISIKSAHIRFRSPCKNGGYQYSVVKEAKMPLYEAWKLEQKMLSDFKEEKYMPENHFPGHLECINISSQASVLAGIY